jgi:hypothetical protein
MDPPEPDCADRHDHDWQSPYSILGGCKANPGVTGNGGGVIVREVCLYCGSERVTDTWAQNPADGTQGLRSVSYTADKYNGEVITLRAQDEVDTYGEDGPDSYDDAAAAFRRVFLRDADDSDGPAAHLWSEISAAANDA